MAYSILFQSGSVYRNGKLETNDLLVEGEKISQIDSNLPPNNGSVTIPLKGKKVYPGFVNSHDHLLASYLPKVGGNEKHQSWLSYDNLYKSSGVFAERQQIDPEILYYLGAYKNLFAGVTTVFDHIPHHVQNPFRGILPVKLISDYTLAHSIGNYSLGWGEGPALEYRMAEHAGLPFVTHLAEGLDDDSKQSLRLLEKMDALGGHSVLVHCLPFGPKEVEKILEKGASVVWCPTSNLHIFGKTTNIKLFLDMGVNVCLGTDYSPSGAVNLLEELKTAKSIYFGLYGEELAETTLLKMVTENPRKAFRLGNPDALMPGLSADLLIINDDKKASEVNLSELSFQQIDLVVVDGYPIYGSEEYRSLFLHFGLETEELSFGGKLKLVAGSPKKLLKQVSDSVGYKKSLAFLPNF
ncbi:cytosine/adenosine deaminase-related metal-dependent hydrolase [Leptospira meyeri]|uniref:Cytosine/adenosine deaminase-related metal-dependent hydrolase n=1 Tax=Leptospira meyeri TaxID=29508 RepID=A0A4R8MYH2_LEPME|nr:amidohydrolase family protein [Leptospira meyeri]EKJ85313.1 amidohydrolase [Leptospira meyeri serovar Hardjo str. Went 5]TDY72095.1 cytosine/adenosine deaminase-related metal-dependent hydrolase [Leptospira meyeri]TGL43976.1 hydrolase [Leptospira meyeri]